MSELVQVPLWLVVLSPALIVLAYLVGTFDGHRMTMRAINKKAQNG